MDLAIVIGLAAVGAVFLGLALWFYLKPVDRRDCVYKCHGFNARKR